MSDYIPESEDRVFTEGGSEFLGMPLAPFGTGVRLTWLNLNAKGDHADFMCCSLLWILVELQKEFNSAIKEGGDLEKTWFIAKARMLATVKDKDMARGRVLEFIEKIGKSKGALERAVAKSLDILAAAEESEMEPSGGIDLGESQRQPQLSKSTKSRKKPTGKGKR